MAKYITEFKSKDDICDRFNIDSRELKGVKIVVAWYGYGDYSGSSLVIFERDGNLYEVNASHCSCYGLEGQWSPEETSWEALSKRNFQRYGHYDGEEEAHEALKKIVRRKMKAAVIA